MAADIKRIVRNLLDFFDFSGLTVITVGAGGGRFIEYARSAAKVIAVDQDPASSEALRAKLGPAGLTDKFTLVHSDFMEFREKSDVVLFERRRQDQPGPGLSSFVRRRRPARSRSQNHRGFVSR